MKVVFAAQSNRDEDDLQKSPERLLNVYPEASGEGVVLRSCPGLAASLADIGAQPRAMLGSSKRGEVFIVSGGVLYRYMNALISVGPIDDDPETTMDEDDSGNIGIVANGKYFVWDGATLDQVAQGAFTEYGSIAYANQSFVLTELNGSRHAVTGVNKPKSISALDFSNADYKSDNLLRVISDSDQIWFFGEKTIELWANVGGSGYPLSRITGGVIDIGCKAMKTVVEMENSIIWVANDDTVRRAVEGSTPQVISDHQISDAIQKASNLNAYTYNWKGHKYYVLRFGNRPAWVYDEATGLWHEKTSGVDIGSTTTLETAELGGKWYAATTEGELCLIDSIYTENGRTYLRSATSKNITLDGKWFNISMFDIDIQRGLGSNIELEFSRDEGRNFGRKLIRESTLADYQKRIRVRNLGGGPDFCARVSTASPTDFSIHGCTIESLSFPDD